MVHVTAQVLRAKNRLFHHLVETEITAVEQEEAILQLVCQEQGCEFSLDIARLAAGKKLNLSSRIRMFNPFIDKDGILGLGGRLQKYGLPYSEQHPMLLEVVGHFVKKLVFHTHERLFHAGVRETLAEVRERFWIIKGRKMVQQVIRKCVWCQRYSSPRMVVQEAPLPNHRVRPEPVFSTSDVDFAGPLWVTLGTKKPIKSYITLFTCSSTRTIHLELVPDMGTVSFLQALRRFFATHGISKQMVSDNAKTFCRAGKDLMRIWASINGLKAKEYYASHGVV